MIGDLQLVDEHSEVLQDIALSIFDFNAELKILAKKMLNFMYNSHGIGLAAPQIGLSKRLCVIDVYQGVKEIDDEVDFVFDGKDDLHLSDIQPMILVNPIIEEISVETEIAQEGCLSLPGVVGKVKRAKEIVVSYFDADGKKHRIKSNGILARCMQHEIDHLDGVLFINLATDVKRTKKP